MWRDIFLVSFLLLARAGQRARPVHDEARAIAVQRVRRDLPAAAIDFDRDYYPAMLEYYRAALG